MVSSPIAVGDVIADKYSVERLVGEGGMGMVFAARHRELDQRVAIKFLLPEIAQQGMAAERFRREARAAARIRGEHVCRVLDVGTLTTGIPYMVMEYLDGCDLSHELHRRSRLPPEEAVGYLLEACDAVAEAHAAGIVHRDLKPANLFLATRSDGSRRIKVLDFGVSKSLIDSNSGQHALTVTSSVVGSPLYMSPEQLDSAKDVDRRTDIWALGVVLYEMLAGRTPFRGDSIPQLVSAVMHTEPPALRDLSVTAPDGLEDVLRKALRKPRDQRFTSIAELVSALAPYAPRHLGSLVPGRGSRVVSGGAGGSASGPHATLAMGGSSLELSATSPSRPSSPPVPWQQRTTDRGARSRWGTGLAAVVVLAAVLFIVYRLAAGPSSPPELTTRVTSDAPTVAVPEPEPAPRPPSGAATPSETPPPAAEPAPTNSALAAPAPSAPSGTATSAVTGSGAAAASPTGVAAPGAAAAVAASPASPVAPVRPRRPRPAESPAPSAAEAAPGGRATDPAGAPRPAAERLPPVPGQSNRGLTDFGGRR